MTTHAQRYFVPHNSPWSFLMTVGFFALLFGTATLLNGVEKVGLAVLCVGAVVMIACMAGWWRLVIQESESRTYHALEDSSFRWGMVFFIFSEVCFFGAFFGALFYSRLYVLPFLSGASNNLF